MSMKMYPILGYGIGIDWEDKEALLRIIKTDKVVEILKKELGEDVEIDDEVLINEFLEDSLCITDEIIYELNSKFVFKDHPKEKYGFSYELAHDKYFIIHFAYVPYGHKAELTISDTHKIVDNLFSYVFDGLNLENRDYLKGHIEETYLG